MAEYRSYRVFPVYAFLTEKVIYPYLVGGDIGCGMGVWQTNIKSNKIRRDKWVKKLVDLDSPWDGDRKAFMDEFDLDEWGKLSICT